ncbi:SDR family oxidoreductase [Paraburkholderia sp. UYCP14C]|uniref:SDR family NAD(P)-dependent oxidoreductase n=1 Tax=Paraburkholderia sp. UYCP14C TaxID=2511130 RepID=UPI00101FD97D|nr:SDR family oxidoreductase [Paraburkholderia sp. UYCP14C]RZF25729.1 SDR family oxidoreductase [Paraburkholderia sp. UYCP14C]
MHIPVTPSMRLDGRRALVTGAGRGLGLAAASALAAAGAEVVLAARSSQEVHEAAAAIGEAGGKASGVALDVVDLEATSAWLEHAPAFDILVNNAGTNRPAAFLNTEAADYDFVFNVNVRAAFFIAQGVARKLVRDGRPGSIINLSSQMGHVGAARRTVYCATKHAVEGMTKAMAAELGAHAIRVNTLCPTFIETPMTKPFFADGAFRDAVLGKLKLGRLGVPEDIMGAIVFLASDASALMTGSALMLDSGWTSTS